MKTKPSIRKSDYDRYCRKWLSTYGLSVTADIYIWVFSDGPPKPKKKTIIRLSREAYQRYKDALDEINKEVDRSIDIDDYQPQRIQALLDRAFNIEMQLLI